MDATDLVEELRQLALQNCELRATQQALEESRRCYADLFDFAPVAYFTFSRSGYIREVNLAGAGLLERPRAQLLDRPFPLVARLERADAFFRHLEHCWTTRQRTVSELALVSAGGRKRFVQVESAPLGGAPGQPIAIRTTMSDISAFKEAEESLRRAAGVERELRQRLELLARAEVIVSEEVLHTNLEGVLRTIVEQARALIGSDAAALGLGDGDGEPFRHFVASGLDDQSAALVRDGQEVPGLHSVEVCCHEGGGRLFVSYRRGRLDLTGDDRQLLEALASRVAPALELARLREQEARERGRLEILAEASAISARSLDFDNVLDAVAHLALPRLGDCCVVYVEENGQLRQAAAAHVDPAREPLLRRAHSALMRLADQPLGATQRAFETGKVTLALDFDLSTVDARAVPPEVLEDFRQLGPRSIVALPLAADGHMVGVASLAWCRDDRHYEASDVVLLRAIFTRAALALENARLYRDLGRALEARDDMLAVVAHDLRNPLGSIRINANLLMRAVSDPPARACITRQEQAASNMLRLVDDLLDAAALDAGAVTLELDRHRVAALLDQAMASVGEAADRRHVQIELEADPAAQLRCDGQRIVQVLSNLLSNAIKASPEGGVVHLSARTDGPRTALSVRDEGPGIATEVRPNLFRRYWKGQKLGTGLGLYIAKRIVDAHGGRLEVESEPGRGATFTVVL